MPKFNLSKGNGLDAANDQPAKSLTKHTADFIVSITQGASFCWPGLLVLAQALLLALMGVLS